MGYLPQAMVNYLALLGWGDGTENEFFTINDLGLLLTIHLPFPLGFFLIIIMTCLYVLTLVPRLFAVEKFTISRVNKSGAVFDATKLK